MLIRFIASSSVLVVAAALLAAPVARAVGLPDGATARIRLMDYVNTVQQPLGYTYRGTVDGSVSVGARLVVPDKAKVLMRLAHDPDVPGGLTLEWWAIKFGDDWSEFRGASEATGLFTILERADDHRLHKSNSLLLAYRGPSLYIPFDSILHVKIRRPVRFHDVGRFQ
jgi:hypothetical protein